MLAEGINQFVATVQGIVTDTATSVHELQQAAVNSARQTGQQGWQNSHHQLEQVELVATAIHEMSSTADSRLQQRQITAQAVDETRHAVQRVSRW